MTGSVPVPDECATRPTMSAIAVPTATVTDRRLSFLALGILVEVMTYPPDAAITVEALAAVKRGSRRVEGRDVVRAALAELEAGGYLVREQVRNPHNGRLRTVVSVRPAGDR